VHLSLLKRQGVISVWHDRRLGVGDDVDPGISRELERANIILLLVSPDFLASDYCYSVEMTRAMERHQSGESRVIPVILRPCDWHHAPFGKLLAAPRDGKAVTKWTDADEAFLDITNAIRAVTQAKGNHRAPPRVVVSRSSNTDTASRDPRSSNLRLRKSFTDHDRDRFLDDAFEFMARFFENSLEELKSRNPGFDTAFKRIDATKFTASVYQNGAALARCQIRLAGQLGNGIALSHGTNFSDNGFNENLSVEVGEQALTLRPLGLAISNSSSRQGGLSFEGAAEYYWDMFIQPMQR
jgi:hypothetical protein